MNPIETHEKNLAWIDEEIKSISEQFISDEGYTNSLRANRKVLGRHAPHMSYFTPPCRTCNGKFPCQTYTDITEGLGIPK